MKLVWSGKNTQMHTRKKNKVTQPNINHTSFKSEQYKRQDFNCVCILLFPFTAVTDCSVALTQLFTSYACKTQSHLQREISRAAVNRRVNLMVPLSLSKQNVDLETPATWQGLPKDLQAHCKLLL